MTDTDQLQFDVKQYNIHKGMDSLREVCDFMHKDKFSQKDRLFQSNSHITYLVDYFKKLHEADENRNVQTVVAEYEYVEKDFLDSYAHHYSLSFRKYDKRCVRLHFFTCFFKKDDLKSFLTSYKGGHASDWEKYQNAYEGFVVIRPIPTFIGRTCLRPFPHGDEKKVKRYYPATRINKVHLFGVEFSVVALLYQEQDKDVGVCATVALWVAFQKTGNMFNHSIPSLYQITQDSMKYRMPPLQRSIIPGKGLNPPQMAYAIAMQNLQPLEITPPNTGYFNAQVYAYLKSGIPVILALDLYTGELIKI